MGLSVILSKLVRGRNSGISSAFKAGFKDSISRNDVKGKGFADGKWLKEMFFMIGKYTGFTVEVLQDQGTGVQGE